MSGTIIENFYTAAFKNASFQVEKNGIKQPGTSFGCVGKIEGETESKIMDRKCEGILVETITIPQRIILKIAGKFPVSVLRDIFGLKA